MNNVHATLFHLRRILRTPKADVAVLLDRISFSVKQRPNRYGVLMDEETGYRHPSALS